MSAIPLRWYQRACPSFSPPLKTLDAVKRVRLDTDRLTQLVAGKDITDTIFVFCPETYAGAGIPVVSNNSAHRATADVPMMVPEVNWSHARLIEVQRQTCNWDRGCIAVKPNCSVQSYVTPLFALSQAGYRLGLITNGLPCLQREKIAGSRLGHYFDATVISGDLGVAKPDPAIFTALLTQLGVEAAEALMVGNSVKGDIGGAQGVGMKAALIDRGDVHAADESIEPDLVIERLDALLSYCGQVQ